MTMTRLKSMAEVRRMGIEPYAAGTVEPESNNVDAESPFIGSPFSTEKPLETRSRSRLGET
mgnify:CR=1 FL=1